jgi:hypothetical protein
MLRVLPADLSRAQLKVCSDLFAKAEACLVRAKEASDYLEEFAGDEEDEEDERARAEIEKFRALALGHLEHVRDLCVYWGSKHPEQTL